MRIRQSLKGARESMILCARNTFAVLAPKNRLREKRLSSEESIYGQKVLKTEEPEQESLVSKLEDSRPRQHVLRRTSLNSFAVHAVCAAHAARPALRDGQNVR